MRQHDVLPMRLEISERLDAAVHLPLIAEDDWYGRYVSSQILASVVEDCYRAYRLYGSERSNETDFYRLSGEIHFQSSDLISIYFIASYEASPSLAPNNYAFSRNYFGKALGRLSLREIFDSNTEFLKLALRRCDDALDDAFRLSDMNLKEEELWSLLGQFNFDKRDLLINLSSYALLPSAFSVRQVTIPLPDVVDMILPPLRSALLAS
jgi:hypothetical protein